MNPRPLLFALLLAYCLSGGTPAAARDVCGGSAPLRSAGRAGADAGQHATPEQAEPHHFEKYVFAGRRATPEQPADSLPAQTGRRVQRAAVEKTDPTKPVERISVSEVADRHAARRTSREQKAQRKAQKRKLRREILHFERLRDEAAVKFAREHQPADIRTPSWFDDFRITNLICAGDLFTGTVMLRFDITPQLGSYRLYMGGERNGTQAIANGNSHPASDHYGRVYTLRPGQPEQVIVEFYNISRRITRFDRVDISMGLSLNVLHLITLRDVPICWTYSDRAIGNYVRGQASKQ